MDTRSARWWSNDPVFQPFQCPYNMMDGNPILLTDLLGNKTDDKFYDDQGNFLFDDGNGDDLYVVHNAFYNYYDKVSEKLKKIVLKAYSSEDMAVYEWSDGNLPLTRKDHLERAPMIFSIDTDDASNPKLFVLGQTVVGEKLSVDPTLSKPVMPGLGDLTKEGLIGKYELEENIREKIGIFGRYEDGKYYTKKWVGEWKMVAAVHTHPPGYDDFSGFSLGDDFKEHGDAAIAKQLKINIYLCPTTEERPKVKLLNSSNLKGRDQKDVERATRNMYRPQPQSLNKYVNKRA